MLDHLTQLVPQWTERDPAAQSVAVVEVLAYAADYLTYFQDAVATEAYLETARRRISVRRHARLIDDRLHEGCNSRVWLVFEVTAHTSLPAHQVCLTQSLDLARTIPKAKLEEVVSRGGFVYESLDTAELYTEHNSIDFYSWGAANYTLPRGTTTVALEGPLPHLNTGDVLIFEQVPVTETGPASDAKPRLRHAVRLAGPPIPIRDPLHPSASITEIHLHSADALPFDFPVKGARVDGHPVVGVARGNVVLADEGRTVHRQEVILEQGKLFVERGRLPPAPEEGEYCPALEFENLTYRVPFDPAATPGVPASALLRQDPSAVEPAVRLFEISAADPDGEGGRREWYPRYDLLSSGPFSRTFVVETDNDHRSHLRFGDGELGMRPAPGTRFQVSYRISGGLRGEVGAGAITHVVTSNPQIKGVRNPLPARGAVVPQATERIQRNAPFAFKSQERSVSEADYVTRAKLFPEVSQAAAERQGSGSWVTAIVWVDRVDGPPADVSFLRRVHAYLQPFQLAGGDLAVRPPRFIPLEIVLRVTVGAGFFQQAVTQRLLARFGHITGSGGEPGFFSPQRFGFGEPFYLSTVVAAANEVVGVARVEAERFQRWGLPERGALESGRIELAPNEIARVDNRPGAPENGSIGFRLEGGR